MYYFHIWAITTGFQIPVKLCILFLTKLRVCNLHVILISSRSKWVNSMNPSPDVAVVLLMVGHSTQALKLE